MMQVSSNDFYCDCFYLLFYMPAGIAQKNNDGIVLQGIGNLNFIKSRTIFKSISVRLANISNFWGKRSE